MSRFLTPIVANLDPDYRFSSKFIIIGDREGGVAVNSRDKKHGTDQNGSDKTGSDVGDDNGEPPDDECHPPVGDEGVVSVGGKGGG